MTNEHFITTKVTVKVPLEPHELNNDIAFNLRERVLRMEKRCHRFGYLHRIIKILEYKDGIMIPEDLACRARYTVTMKCIVCDPIVDSYVIAVVKKIDRMLITSSAGPILFLTPTNKISDKFKMSDNSLFYGNTEVKPGDHLLLRVAAKKFHDGDTEIKVFGIAVDLSTESDFNAQNNLVMTSEEET